MSEYLRCRDCSAYQSLSLGDMFMVHDELWARYGTNDTHYEWKPLTKEQRSKRRGILCFECLQKRMGRPITKQDLKPNIPINQWWIAQFDLRGEPISKSQKEKMMEEMIRNVGGA